MILLSISPFIFIQCGSGGPIGCRPIQNGKAAPPAAGGGRGWFIDIKPPASILERRTAVPRCALFVLSEISAARRIRRLFALPQHLPQSRHRAAELFLAAGVSRHQPKKYSKRS